MTSPVSLRNLCRYVLDYEEGRYADDPIRLGAVFREYTGIQRTPTMAKTVDLVRSLGINIKTVDYLKTGGTNMSPKGSWHIHYSAKDKPATQKFTIFHELFEVIHRSIGDMEHTFNVLKDPQLSQAADRFAAAVLIPPRFFSYKATETGCDLVKLAEDLELSHQCLLIALGQHFGEIPFVGALYEHRLDAGDFIATVVVKTPRARRIKNLCGLQPVPLRNGHSQTGSLVCAAVTGGYPVLWRSTRIEDSPVILVRPLLSAGGQPYRVILLAVPSEQFGMISLQAETIEAIPVNGDLPCPAEKKCQNSNNCIWKSRGGYDEY